MKHMLMPPPKGKHRPNPDDYIDTTLPELLFYIVELKSELRFIFNSLITRSPSRNKCHFLFQKGLFIKHKMVVQNYYLRYMGGYDAHLMRNTVQVFTVLLLLSVVVIFVCCCPAYNGLSRRGEYFDDVDGRYIGSSPWTHND